MSKMFYVWVALSVAYVVTVISVGLGLEIRGINFNIAGIERPGRLHEWGDYLAGFVSPLALLWVIGALFSQRREHLETAKLTLRANQIAARAAIEGRYTEYRSRLDSIKEKIFRQIGLIASDRRKRLYNSVSPEKYHSGQLDMSLHRRSIGSDDFAALPIDKVDQKPVIETFATLLFFMSDEDLRELVKVAGSSMLEIQGLMEKYVRIFDQFYDRASEAESLFLVDEDDEYLAKAFKNYFSIVSTASL